MALQKEIELENGIVVRYHRIVSINKITNNQIILEVGSYTSKEKRDEEIAGLTQKQPMNVYIATDYINIPYEETNNIQDYYDYLKTTDKFKDAIDV